MQLNRMGLETEQFFAFYRILPVENFSHGSFTGVGAPSRPSAKRKTPSLSCVKIT